MTTTSQAEGSGTVSTHRPSWPALVDDTGNAVEAGGSAARHTRAWSVDAPAVVADCRRLRFRRGVAEAFAVAECGKAGPFLGRPRSLDSGQ
jgi:hypothetical protein